MIRYFLPCFHNTHILHSVISLLTFFGIGPRQEATIQCDLKNVIVKQQKLLYSWGRIHILSYQTLTQSVEQHWKWLSCIWCISNISSCILPVFLRHPEGEKICYRLWVLPIWSATCNTVRYTPPVYSWCIQIRDLKGRRVVQCRAFCFTVTANHCQISLHQGSRRIAWLCCIVSEHFRSLFFRALIFPAERCKITRAQPAKNS